MIEHALAYARRGWAVFPVRPPDNTPLVARGFHDATTDPDTITTWWSRWPSANVAARCGECFDVLDIDCTDFAEGVADLPDCVTDGGPVARSGGGGWHLFFKPSGLGRRIRFSEHCDWLGVGGYVVLPPSSHRSGGVYAWFGETEHLELTDPPADLVEAVRTRCGRDRPENRLTRSPLSDVPAHAGSKGAPGWSPAGLVAKVATAPHGERNATLNWAANRIGLDVRSGRSTEDAAIAALDQITVAARRAGLGEREVAATVRSGYLAGANGQGNR